MKRTPLKRSTLGTVAVSVGLTLCVVYSVPIAAQEQQARQSSLPAATDALDAGAERANGLPPLEHLLSRSNEIHQAARLNPTGALRNDALRIKTRLFARCEQIELRSDKTLQDEQAEERCGEATERLDEVLSLIPAPPGQGA
ncbi:MAG: hypothetical protein KDD69_04360 [Bdellovibrionales bacterium]|nr:hypothetical protein [Bdellovibrionales bacterium]